VTIPRISGYVFLVRGWIGALWVSSVAAGCSSFELELDVLPQPVPASAEVRIDGEVPSGGVYRASFGSYEEARRAVIPIEVLRGGVVVDTWSAPVEACAWVCAMLACPDGDVVRAKLEVGVNPDGTLVKSYEGQCSWEGGTIAFYP